CVVIGGISHKTFSIDEEIAYLVKRGGVERNNRRARPAPRETGSRSRNSQAGLSRPTQTNPPVTNTARLSTTAQTTAPTPTSSATSVAAPQPAPSIPITTSTQSTSNLPLEDRLESLPLSRRMELDAPISDPPVENPGGSAPSSSTTFSPGFDWNGHLINSVDDYHSIRDAANRGSDSALLHIGFLNATQQRIPHHLRSAGVKELLKDWAHFSKPHEAKRIRLHEKHGIKLRTKSRRTSDTQDDAPSSQISERVLDNPIAMDTDAAPNPDQPPPVPAPVSGHTSDRERGPIALQDAPMAQADESRLSVVGLQFADMNPEDWPPGIRADIDGQPVTISADMLRVPHTPYADDVHAWEVMNSLAPALDEHDPTSTERRDEFIRLAIRVWSVPDYVMVLYGLMGAPMGERPVEHYPFEMDPYNTVHIAAWFHDHGIELESETAENLHQYAISAYPFLPGALATGPPTLGQMRAGLAGQRVDIFARRFQYPALHFTQPERDWTTATEDYFISGRAGLGFSSSSSFPPVEPVAPRAVRPDSGPYSIPSNGTEAPRSAPTPEPGPPISDPSRRSPSEEPLDYGVSYEDGPAGM
ncbi:hypothetical protein HWV62_36328, partial [Athelia sp. TMB]